MTHFVDGPAVLPLLILALALAMAAGHRFLRLEIRPETASPLLGLLIAPFFIGFATSLYHLHSIHRERINVIHEEAEAEVSAAVDWYETRRVGLGGELLEEFACAIQSIEDGFNGTPCFDLGAEGAARRVLLDRFPYAVIFLTAGREVEVLAFAHLRRSPGYWRGR